MPRNDTKEIYSVNVTPRISSYRVYLSQSSQKKKQKRRNLLLVLKQEILILGIDFKGTEELRSQSSDPEETWRSGTPARHSFR